MSCRVSSQGCGFSDYPEEATKKDEGKEIQGKVLLHMVLGKVALVNPCV